MKKNFITAILMACALAFTCAAQTDQSGSKRNKAAVAFEQYTSYFEKNNSGLPGDTSYLAFTKEQNFDKVFGTAATMDSNSFLPPDAFKSKLVVAAIKRGNLRRYENVKVTQEKGKLYVWYDTKDDAPGSATFSSPLIIAVDKGKYKEVVFMENGKQAGKARIK